VKAEQNSAAPDDTTPRAEVSAATLRVSGCVNLPWPEYLTLQNEAWERAHRLANALVHELFMHDPPPWREGSDPQLKSLDTVFGQPCATLAYRLAVSERTGLAQFSRTLPSCSVAQLTRRIAGDYARRRRGVMEHMNDSHPLFKFGNLPIPVASQHVQLKPDPENPDHFLLTYPLYRTAEHKTVRVTVRIERIRKDRTSSSNDGELSLLAKINAGLVRLGSIAIDAKRRRVSAKEAKDLPVRRDRNRNRFLYEPVIRLSIYEPDDREPGSLHGMVLIHTDPQYFLAAHVGRNVRWCLCQDQVRARYNMLKPEEMRDLIMRHDALVQRLKLDTKGGDKGARTPSEVACDRQARCLDNFVKHVVHCLVQMIERRKFAEVVFLNTDAFVEKCFMPHFPWNIVIRALRQRLEPHVRFREASAFDFLKHRNEKKEFDYAAIYLSLRADKANQTKRDKVANQCYVTENNPQIQPA